jgi:hypothetical protein
MAGQFQAQSWSGCRLNPRFRRLVNTSNDRFQEYPASRAAVSLLLQIEYGNPVCLKIVPEIVQPFIKAFGPRAVR